MSNNALRVSEQVRDALASGTPVVALESTIFTHGLPRPRNVEVALRGEEIIRQAGGVPATIGRDSHTACCAAYSPCSVG